MKTRLALEAVLLFHTKRKWGFPQDLRWQQICREMLGARNSPHDRTPDVLCQIVHRAQAGSQEIR